MAKIPNFNKKQFYFNNFIKFKAALMMPQNFIQVWNDSWVHKDRHL